MEQSPMNPKPNPPAIDLQPLIDSGMEEMLPQLIAIFLETAPRTIENAGIALRASNAWELTHAVHSLNGSCSNFGATRLRELCKQLENLGRSESLQAAPGLLESVEKEFIIVQAELLSYLERAE
jgi:HPt (histidine-containing phosphotransfer) domain-containing protein